MPTELIMPQLAMSMTEGELKEWLVEDGATVAQGQPIYSVEGEKATQEIDAPSHGVLRHLGVPGQIYAVGVKIGEIE